MAELTAQDFQNESTEELFEADSLTDEDIEVNTRQSIIPEIVGTGLSIAIPAVIGVVESLLVDTKVFGHYTSNEIYQPVLTATLIYLPYAIHKLTHKVYNRISGKKTRIGLMDIVSSIPLSLTTQNTAAWGTGKILGWRYKMGYVGEVDKHIIIKSSWGKDLLSDSGLGLSKAHLISGSFGVVTFILSLANRLKHIKGFNKLDSFESKVYNFISEFSSRSPLHNYTMNMLFLSSAGLPATLMTGNFLYAASLYGYSIVDIVARGGKFKDHLFEKYGERIIGALTSFTNKLPI